MRAFMHELSWKDVTKDEILSNPPGLEIEIDGDARVVRVYQTLMDIFGKKGRIVKPNEKSFLKKLSKAMEKDKIKIY